MGRRQKDGEGHDPDQRYLDEIAKAAAQLAEITRRYDLAAFAADQIVFDATAMNLVRLGEAATHLSQPFTESHPDVDWKGFRDLRNIIAHQYWSLAPDRIWETASREVPDLTNRLGITPAPSPKPQSTVEGLAQHAEQDPFDLSLPASATGPARPSRSSKPERAKRPRPPTGVQPRQRCRSTNTRTGQPCMNWADSCPYH